MLTDFNLTGMFEDLRLYCWHQNGTYRMNNQIYMNAKWVMDEIFSFYSI
jgi:hypothetical protein